MQEPKTNPAVYGRIRPIEFCSWTGMHEYAGPPDVIRATEQSATLGTFNHWYSTRYPSNFNVIVLALLKDSQSLINQKCGPAKLTAPDFAKNSQVEQIAEQAASDSREITKPLHLRANQGKPFFIFFGQKIHARFQKYANHLCLKVRRAKFIKPSIQLFQSRR